MANKPAGPSNEAARKGGLTTKRRHGPEYYAELGRLGGLAKAKNQSKAADAARSAAAAQPE